MGGVGRETDCCVVALEIAHIYFLASSEGGSWSISCVIRRVQRLVLITLTFVLLLLLCSGLMHCILPTVGVVVRHRPLCRKFGWGSLCLLLGCRVVVILHCRDIPVAFTAWSCVRSLRQYQIRVHLLHPLALLPPLTLTNDLHSSLNPRQSSFLVEIHLCAWILPSRRGLRVITRND